MSHPLIYSVHRPSPRYFTFAFLFIAVLFVACTPVAGPTSLAQTRTPEIVLVPYHTSTSTATLSPSLVKPSQTPLPPPSPTPFTHTIKKDETVLGVALKYGIKLEDLLAANPGINIRFLSIGTVLVIPLTGELATPTPTVAPPPLSLTEPDCYITLDKHLQCIAEIKNPLEQAYEKLTLRFALYAADGTLISEQYIVPPLDRILPEGTLPVMATFSNAQDDSDFTEKFTVQLSLLSALPAASADDQTTSVTEYLDASIQDLTQQISENELSAQITGKVLAQEGTGSIWLVAVAYNEEEKPVGLRRQEINNICPIQTIETLELPSSIIEKKVCAELPFQLFVYSLGPAIKRVELLVEAHP